MDAREDRPAEIIAQSTGENEGEHATDATNNDTDSQAVKPKRVVKLTAKALAEKLEKLQDERKTKLNKASKVRKRLSELIQDGKNAEVQCYLDYLVKLCDETTCVHDSLMGLLDEVEKEKHDIWFKAKMISNNECISYVKRWVTGVEHQTLMGNDDDDDDDDESMMLMMLNMMLMTMMG